MNRLAALYRPSLSLLTDLYQLTMAAGYWKLGRAEQESVFTLHFRKPPFGGSWAVAAGLSQALDYLENLAFDQEDLAYLSELKAADGRPLFEQGFVDYLGGMRQGLHVAAIPEGELALPLEPLLRVQGPLLQAQLVETPLLTLMNFQTLIATKAARICRAAQGEAVLEFGLRRAQGFDGGLSASRAAWIGGVAATSNVLAGRLYGIPVRGTHAHSWVLSHEREEEAFSAYAEVMPHNCTLLVDTYDTAQGLERASRVGQELAARGESLAGVRLDSGDLAELARLARRTLDAAGLTRARVVASNDLDEKRISALKAAGAPIDVWGVGTRLVTGHDQPALGGVYKLAALRGEEGGWRYRVKRSEDPVKVSLPGRHGVLRRRDAAGTFVGDLIYDVDLGLSGQHHDLIGQLGEGLGEEVMVEAMRGGQRLLVDDLAGSRARCAASLSALPEGPASGSAPYPVALDQGLYQLQQQLLAAGGR